MRLWTSFCRTRGEVAGLPRLRGGGRDREHDERYHLIGASRSGHRFSVFQYTLSGCGLLLDGHGSHRVPAGQGFLCRADDPLVRYRYPPGATTAWDFVFITWYGLEEAVAALITQGPIFTLPRRHTLIQEMLARQRLSGRALELDPGASALQAMRVVAALCDARSPPRPLADGLAERATALIAGDSGPHLTAADCARLLGVSREHLSRIFAQACGHTLREALQRRRLREACRALLQSTATVGDIAQACGYQDATHLARLCRRHLGLTPSAYRRAAQTGSAWLP